MVHEILGNLVVLWVLKLTHWGQVTHIYVSLQHSNICSINGLMPVRQPFCISLSVLMESNQKQMAGWLLLRTPISAKYCWFGWWLGAWSTSSHHPTQLCDIYISGYKYTLISEWTRLFGLLRILDNLIAGAVCYFCTTISVFCEIYTLRMRVVAHAAIVWVGWFLCRRPELG